VSVDVQRAVAAVSYPMTTTMKTQFARPARDLGGNSLTVWEICAPNRESPPAFRRRWTLQSAYCNDKGFTRVTSSFLFPLIRLFLYE
jgi:hypothetical protein